MMKKIYALSLPLALSAVAENGEIKAQSHDASRPNVLLIIADDLGKGDVSAYGSKSISTPDTFPRFCGCAPCCAAYAPALRG